MNNGSFTMPYGANPDANGPENPCAICGKALGEVVTVENGERFHPECWIETTEEDTDPGVPVAVDEDETTPVPVESMASLVWGAA